MSYSIGNNSEKERASLLKYIDRKVITLSELNIDAKGKFDGLETRGAVDARARKLIEEYLWSITRH